jgi:hypothetical protein
MMKHLALRALQTVPALATLLALCAILASLSGAG